MGIAANFQRVHRRANLSSKYEGHDGVRRSWSKNLATISKISWVDCYALLSHKIEECRWKSLQVRGNPTDLDRVRSKRRWKIPTTTSSASSTGEHDHQWDHHCELWILNLKFRILLQEVYDLEQFWVLMKQLDSTPSTINNKVVICPKFTGSELDSERCQNSEFLKSGKTDSKNFAIWVSGVHTFGISGVTFDISFLQLPQFHDTVRFTGLNHFQRRL